MLSDCTGLQDKRSACKAASSHLQARSQKVQELATISEPRARYMIHICVQSAATCCDMTQQRVGIVLDYVSRMSFLQA